MGLLATMAALVLSLLIASAKGTYDTQSSELTQLAANAALLDRVLAHYGPEAKEARDLLRRSVARAIDQMWPTDHSSRSDLRPAAGGDDLYDKIQALPAQTDAQRSLRTDALSISVGLGRIRSLLLAQGGARFPCHSS